MLVVEDDSVEIGKIIYHKWINDNLKYDMDEEDCDIRDTSNVLNDMQFGAAEYIPNVKINRDKQHDQVFVKIKAECEINPMKYLGTNCAKNDCRKLDFLPIKCQECQKLFCNDHFLYENHGCQNSNKIRVFALCCC